MLLLVTKTFVIDTVSLVWCAAGLRDSENKVTDDEVRDNDTLRKSSGKEYGDRKRKAKDSALELGDKVYVKNIIKEKKLTSNFNPTQLLVKMAVTCKLKTTKQDRNIEEM